MRGICVHASMGTSGQKLWSEYGHWIRCSNVTEVNCRRLVSRRTEERKIGIFKIWKRKKMPSNSSPSLLFEHILIFLFSIIHPMPTAHYHTDAGIITFCCSSDCQSPRPERFWFSEKIMFSLHSFCPWSKEERERERDATVEERIW